MSKKTIIIIVLIVLLYIISIIPFIYSNIKYKQQIKELEQSVVTIYDTAYNRIVLDSIEYKITKKDSIIYNYKKQMNYEIQQNNISSDTDAVKLFYQLLSEQRNRRYLYGVSR